MRGAWWIIGLLFTFLCVGIFVALKPQNLLGYVDSRPILYAEHVTAADGTVLHSNNANLRVHPGGLTKLMTLYVAFFAIQQNDDINLDSLVEVSSNAASEPSPTLGLVAGDSITLRYLLRATALHSANDAATAIAEAITGSEVEFASQMNSVAESIGMFSTEFRNAHGLPETGHYSTAADLGILARSMFFDFPQYYNLFSRQSTDAGLKIVANTNWRFLNRYEGADGIMSSYSRASGFSIIASAERGASRAFAVVLGARSTRSRDRNVSELLDQAIERSEPVDLDNTALSTVTGVPVIRAAEGPFRHAPAHPLGYIFPGQGPDWQDMLNFQSDRSAREENTIQIGMFSNSSEAIHVALRLALVFKAAGESRLISLDGKDGTILATFALSAGIGAKDFCEQVELLNLSCI